MESICSKKTRILDMLMYFLIYLSAFLSVALLVGIIAYVFVKGAGQVNWSFLTGVTSFLKGTVGMKKHRHG